MLNPSVASCFNSSCRSRFKRLGEGKLFIQPTREFHQGQSRRVVWLCKTCANEHTLHYDWEREEFVLIRHHAHGRRIA